VTKPGKINATKWKTSMMKFPDCMVIISKWGKLGHSWI